VGALAERCGLTRSTAWRLLSTLQSQHFVERVADSNSYRIGFAAYQLGATGAESLVASVHPILGELAEATGETASLAVPQGLALVYTRARLRHLRGRARVDAVGRVGARLECGPASGPPVRSVWWSATRVSRRRPGSAWP
jgi:DNA-binding IclR family transcriptional regulator